jgi:elongation factor P
MDQDTYETLTLSAETLAMIAACSSTTCGSGSEVQRQPHRRAFPPHVELTVDRSSRRPRRHRKRRRDQAATLETGSRFACPLFIKEGEKVKVHTETREFAGRA